MVLGPLNSLFLHGSGASGDPPTNPFESPAVNAGLVSDLTSMSGQTNASSAGGLSAGDTSNTSGSGVVGSGEQNNTPQHQNMLPPTTWSRGPTTEQIVVLWVAALHDRGIYSRNRKFVELRSATMPSVRQRSPKLRKAKTSCRRAARRPEAPISLQLARHSRK